MSNTKLLCRYIAEYINEELHSNHAIAAYTIESAIDAFCGGASSNGKEYAVNVIEQKVDIDAQPNFATSLKDYEYYFEQTEKQNKIPLPFANWLLTVKE